MRRDKRAAHCLRPHAIERGIQPQAYASLLIAAGDTRVICGVSLEHKVPPFLEESGRGWITAEYGMLPCATSTRYRREASGRAGRTMEIQRLIGRSLRMMIDLRFLEHYTLRVDCDVLNADGGTRTAAITGAALAVKDAISRMRSEKRLEQLPDMVPVAAVSAGIVDGEVLLDLDYEEDARAEADGNFVMAGDGSWIEVQATAERRPIGDSTFATMQEYARSGIHELLGLWRQD